MELLSTYQSKWKSQEKKNWNRICFVCHVLKNLFAHVFVAVIINAICFVEIYICNRWWWMKLLMTKLNQLAIIFLFLFVNKFNFVTNAQKLIMFQFSLHRKSWWNSFASIQFHYCSILQLSHHCVCVNGESCKREIGKLKVSGTQFKMVVVLVNLLYYI